MTKPRHAWVCLPTYTGQIHIATMRAVFDDMLALANAGIHVTLVDESGNSMIAHGRDVLCAKFLGDETATDLLFIDNDVTWEPGGLVTLMNHPVELVAGLYPRRADPLAFHVRWIEGQKELWADPTTGLLEVEGVPAGFLRISRACLERMVTAFPEKAFADQHAPAGTAWALFDNIHEGKAYFGEDYSFCRRFRQAGGRVWVDPEMTLGHIGLKTFRGSFGDWLRSRITGADLASATRPAPANEAGAAPRDSAA